MKTEEVINKTLKLAQSELLNYKTIKKQKRNCADGCFKLNDRAEDAYEALRVINEALTDDINGGLNVNLRTIDALNEVKRILIRG